MSDPGRPYKTAGLRRKPSVAPIVLAFVVVALVIVIVALFLGGGEVSSRPQVHLVMTNADGLEPGHPVTLSGIQIGRVREVGFAPRSNDVFATLDIEAEHLRRLDPATVFVVRPASIVDVSRVVVASEICVEDHPRGLASDSMLRGYSGALPKVAVEAAANNPECVSMNLKRLEGEIERVLSEFESSIKAPRSSL